MWIFARREQVGKWASWQVGKFASGLGIGDWDGRSGDAAGVGVFVGAGDRRRGGGVEGGFSGDDSGFGGDDGGGERVEGLLLLPFGEHDKSEQGVVGAEHDSATGSGFAVGHGTLSCL